MSLLQHTFSHNYYGLPPPEGRVTSDPLLNKLIFAWKLFFSILIFDRSHLLENFIAKVVSQRYQKVCDGKLFVQMFLLKWRWVCDISSEGKICQ